jgi:aminopeptidase N
MPRTPRPNLTSVFQARRPAAPRIGLSAALALLAAPLAVVLALAGCQSQGGGRARPAPSAIVREVSALPYDIEHYALDLAIDPGARTLHGTCTVQLFARDPDVVAVELDLEGLRVASVREVGGAELPFEQRAGRLAFWIPEPLRRGSSASYAITYGGAPAKGLWFSGVVGNKPTQVFTQGECQDARWWFPCVDEPWERATHELRVTLPAGWKAVAAGRRVERSESPGLVVEHWKMDVAHPAYLTTLVAGELVEQTSMWDGTPLSFLADTDSAPLMDTSFDETDDVLAFLSSATGLRYPYAKYSQAAVENFPFGGMENISATTLTETALVDERARNDGGMEGLVAHEAAHQWYGDLLTCADWSHVWLNEGLATYLTQLYYESTRGVDEFRARMRDMQDGYIAADVGNDRRPTVHGTFREPMDLFFKGGQTYGGAACRLHLLRFELGDAKFFEGLRTYTNEYAGRSVTTAMFQRAFEKVSGRDLSAFFQQWFHAAGYPELRIGWSHDAGKGVARVTVEQTQSAERGTPFVFRAPVVIEVRDAGGPRIQRVELTQRRQTFEIPCTSEPLYVAFDKGSWLPKRASMARTAGQALAQLRLDDDVNGRRDAIAALVEALTLQMSGEERVLAVAELELRLHDDCRAIRIAAAGALAALDMGSGPGGAPGAKGSDGLLGTPHAREALRVAAAGDKEGSVRAAALRALARYGQSADLAGFARAQFDAGYSYGSMSAAAELVLAADPDNAYGWLSKQLLRESPHDRLRTGLLAVLGRIEGRASTDQLLSWARDAQSHPNARAAAIQQLAKRPQEFERFGAAVQELLDHPNYRLRGAAIAALAGSSDGRARAALDAYYPNSVDPREKRTIEAALRR